MARLGACLVVALASLARAQGAADLVLHVPTLAENAREELKPIAVDDCTLQPADACVDAPGLRKLLRFSVLALNRGTEDLFLGTPTAGDPRFVFSQCHDHFHFESFARYELRPRGGTTVVKSGQKRSFCIEDLRTDPDAPFARSCTGDPDCEGHGQCANGVCQYNCGYQGIQPGRGDIYESNLDCQWIDTTDVPPGEYDLWVLLNTEEQLPEADYTNNSGTIPVTVGPSSDAPVPTIKVRAKKKAKLGKPLKIRWKPKVTGGLDAIAGYDVLLSRDGGTTFAELLATGLPGSTRKLKWTASGAASETGLVQVVVWTKALQRASGTSRTVRILP
jgi:hypothetical protein